MDINTILEYFDKLNDENAMFIELKHKNPLLVDYKDIIRAKGELIELKTKNGTYITSSESVVGLKILKRIDIMKNVIINDIVDELGDA